MGVIVFTSMLYVKNPQPNENRIETGEEKKSKQKGQFMEKESGRKKKRVTKVTKLVFVTILM